MDYYNHKQRIKKRVEEIKQKTRDKAACYYCKYYRFSNNCDHSSNLIEEFSALVGFKYVNIELCDKLNKEGNCKNYQLNEKA
jgi:hypothetical protein